MAPKTKFNWHSRINFLSIDGLPNMLRAQSKLLFCAWLIVLLGSTAGTLYLIANAVKIYAQNPVSSTQRYLTEEQSVWPTIVLCNMNPFTSSFAIDLLRQANVTMPTSSDNVTSETYWRMYLQIEDYLQKTRGYRLTLD